MKRLLAVAIAVAMLGLTAPRAQAEEIVGTSSWPGYFCTSFDVCMSFAVEHTNTVQTSVQNTFTGWTWWLQPTVTTNTIYYYTLAVTYEDSPYAGALAGGVTAAGIYGSGPTLTFLEIVSQPAGQNWGVCGSNDLNPPVVLLCAAAANGSPAVQGLGVGETVTFSFTSNQALAAGDFGADGTLGFRAHLQGYGPAGCSLKPDSNAPDFLVGGDASAAGCNGSTVPEPMSMLLLASGLGGMALPALRRLRRKHEEA